ncbi:ABC transporter permease [Paenibacillus sp. NPDC058071]|uniref:ABC transporter permease n=1 Tax=Paenibacillus sp. NPDC058071 TaxID=3346326 RepID=UPI0036DF6B34
MRFRDYIVLGWDQLRRRMVVTLLCAMGIAIGSSAIIVAVSFGESISHYAQQQMNSFLKMDEIKVYSNGSETAGDSKEGLTEQKVELIRQLSHVKSAFISQPLDYVNFKVDGERIGHLQLIGTDIDKLADFGYEIGQGSFANQDNAIILTYSSMYDLYDMRLEQMRAQQGGSSVRRGDENRIAYPLYQKQLTLNLYVGRNEGNSKMIEFPVRVVGILKKPNGAKGYEGDRIGYISNRLAERIMQAQKDAGDSSNRQPPVLTIKADSPSNVEQIEKLVQKLNVHTQSNIRYQQETNTQFKIIRLIFGGAGLFILFVASISIIVAMTMSTYQRRRQIGIMKVLGANLSQIRNMFVVESALLGFIGGLAGILISNWVVWGINIVLQKFAESDEILFIDTWVLGVGLFFALFTGIVSGIYPAIKASRTDALTAIKRE